MDSKIERVTEVKNVDVPVVETASPQKEYETKKVLFRSYQALSLSGQL